MALALFDLDNTLLGGDSDHAWGQFIVTKGLVDEESYAADNDRFYQDYLRGELDAVAYQLFSLQPLSGKSRTFMAELHQEFMAEFIEPMWLPAAFQLIEKHRDNGDRLVVITATNRVVVEPIVKRFGIGDLICSEPEIINDLYTGQLIDEPCMGQGKVSKITRWLAAESEKMSLDDAWFYSDSRNDLPLLSLVGQPIAVDPDEKLRAVAKQSNWPVISLR